MSNLYYIDTNILIKYYREEEGTKEIRELVQNNSIYISNWTIVEYVSAIKGILFKQGLNKEEQFERRQNFDLFFDKLKWDIIDKIFYLHNLPNNFHKRATDLIYNYGVKKQMGMKNGDALQIVAFEEFLMIQPESVFVTNDAQLKNILKEIDLKFHDPIPLSK